MAIAPTGDIFKTLEFDGESSKSYGVYITGEAVYNAPEKDVEMISIPGRNGSFALDKGRFENIDVKYPAGIFATNEGDFASAISDFRNYLCSKKGYCRLTDDYNPDEYRLAIYKSGLEVTPAQLKAGQFEITFDCKPQRYMMSGESEVEMVSTGELAKQIMNPTLFESKPLLAITGSGTIRISDQNTSNEYTVVLNNDTVGEIELLPELSYSTRFTSQSSVTFTRSFESVPYSLTDSGDTVTVPYFNIAISLRAASNQTIDSMTISFESAHAIPNYSNYTSETVDERTRKATFFYGEQTWAKGSAQSLAEDSVKIECGVTTTDPSTGTTSTSTKTTNFKIRRLFGSSGFISLGLANITGFMSRAGDFSYGQITATSTQEVLGTPTYIDCDIGEAYKIVNGVVISLNRYIELGSQLPVLAPGINTVRRSSTSTPTSILVTPRWWKV